MVWVSVNAILVLVMYKWLLLLLLLCALRNNHIVSSVIQSKEQLILVRAGKCHRHQPAELFVCKIGTRLMD